MTNVRISVRAIAASVLVDVVVDGRSLTRSLLKATGKVKNEKDQSLLKELCYGTLRWYFQLDALAASLISKPLKNKDQDIRLLILAGLYQLEHLSIPAHAVLSETVEATKDLKKDWAKGLVNAVLRSFQRKKTSLIERLYADRLHAEKVAYYAHPSWLLDEIKSAWPQSWQAVLQANNCRPPMSLRVNALKYDREAYFNKLLECDIEATRLPYSQSGIKLKKPLSVAGLPGFANGAVSVQDEAAQLAAELLQVEAGYRVLDACAAPGGKTCHILERTPSLHELIVLDIDQSRLGKITENLKRLTLDGLQSVKLLQGDASLPGDASTAVNKWWDGELFDRILLDVPCSATGVIRRHPDIKILRRPQDIGELVDIQAAMLAAIWPLLKVGGKLLYATCSVLPQENHQQIQSFLQQHADAKEDLINADWGERQPAGRQILPGDNDMDGFYFARIEKKRCN